jgi:hypothetical protein
MTQRGRIAVTVDEDRVFVIGSPSGGPPLRADLEQ